MGIFSWGYRLPYNRRDNLIFAGYWVGRYLLPLLTVLGAHFAFPKPLMLGWV